MNITEWSTCTTPKPMLESLRGRASDRKLRMFVVACCRRMEHLFVNRRIRRGLELAERCAEGRLTRAQSFAKGNELNLLDYDFVNTIAKATGSPWLTCRDAIYAVKFTTGWVDTEFAGRIADYLMTAVGEMESPDLGNSDEATDIDYLAVMRQQPACIREMQAQAEILRDIFVPPGGRTLIEFDRLRPRTLSLARSIYDDRMFERMPMLAKALEADGILDPVLLGHCRSSNAHFLGCWALDVVLRKGHLTKSEWARCGDLPTMIEFLRQIGVLTIRKSRLFGAAVCRRIWHLLPSKACRDAVEVAERFADAKATERQSRAAYAAVQRLRSRTKGKNISVMRAYHAACETLASHELAENVAWQAAQAVESEKDAHCGLLRCLFGRPLDTSSVDFEMLTRQVVATAQSIYESREFNRMPELAQLLERAKCNDAEMLKHCRGPGPHARGCWVIDRLLGRQ